MKQILNLVTVIAIIGLAVFSGCTKISFNFNPPTPVPTFMTALINGAPFNGVPNGVFNGVSSATNGTQLLITGEDTNTYTYLSINPYKGAGTYIIGTCSPGNSCWIDSTSDTVFSPSTILVTHHDTIKAVYGTVTITATTPNITGTFSFTSIDSTKVTNGSFSAQTP